MARQSEERLVPVTDEGQLKIGDLIVVTGCLGCGGGSHRFLLTRRFDANHVVVDRHGRDVINTRSRYAWHVSPEWCVPQGGGYLLGGGIAAGVVFKVDTGLTADDLAREKREIAKDKRKAKKAVQVRP